MVEPMNGTSLGVYLNDHFAGSVAAIELLGLLESQTGSSEPVVVALRDDIAQDQGKLHELMRTLGVTPSTARRVSAWLTEKLTEVKLRLDDPRDTGLRRLEILEALALGIEGKRALWMALDAGATVAPALRHLDYPALIARAQQQRSVVEGLRLDAATSILRQPADGSASNRPSPSPSQAEA
jgi:hypothetical protein